MTGGGVYVEGRGAKSAVKDGVKYLENRSVVAVNVKGAENRVCTGAKKVGRSVGGGAKGADAIRDRRVAKIVRTRGGPRVRNGSGPELIVAEFENGTNDGERSGRPHVGRRDGKDRGW